VFRRIRGQRADLRRVRSPAAVTQLELEKVTLDSWAGLEGFTALRSLSVLGCEVPDLTALVRLPALQTLIVSESRVPSLAPISELLALRKLVLGIADSDLERFDPTSLVTLNQIRFLQLNVSGTTPRMRPLGASFLQGCPIWRISR